MNIILNYKILDDDIVIPSTSKRALFKITISAIEKNTFQMFYGYKLSGKYSYNIEESDKYKICISSTDKELFDKKKFLKLNFQIQTADDMEDENTVRAGDFKKVDDTMKKLSGKVESIENMQKYQLELEDKFSDSQISSSSRLAFLSICQIIIICLVGLFHVFTLRKIFKEKTYNPYAKF